MTKEQRVGLFTLGGLVLLGLAIEMTVGFGLLRRGYPLYAAFRDVGGLDRGATVRVGGVKAGKVDAIELRPDGVRVTMTIDRRVSIPTGAVAQLEAQALAGQRHVNIAIPEGAGADVVPVAPGATLPTEEARSFTQLAGELGKVAESVDSLATALERDASELLVNLNALVEENRAAVTHALANLDAISTEIAEGRGSLGKLVKDPALYDEAKESLASVRASFDTINLVAQRLERGEGTLGKLLTDDGLYTQAEEAIASLHETAGAFEDVSANLRDGQGTLGKLLTDESLYRETQEAVRGVTRATQGVEDQAPISVLSMFASSLF